MKPTELPTTVFEDLMKIYKLNLRGYDTTQSLIDGCLEKKDYAKIPEFVGRLKAYQEAINDMKNVLQKHFRTDIELAIPKLEQEYIKQTEFAKSAWESYGSELAGDFNKGEILARNKLNLYKSLL